MALAGVHLYCDCHRRIIVKKIAMLIPLLALAPIWASELTSLEEAQALAVKQGKPLMLDFYTDW